ncbi:MAG: ABC transporter permease [Pseudomonadota bacterium]
MTPSTSFSRFVAAYRRSTAATVAAVVLLLILVAAVFAPVLAPQNPYDLAQLDILDTRLPPGSPSADGSKTYLLGTDAQGRDMASAILYGLRISLVVGVSATLFAVAIGIVTGLVAGYFGGRFDAVLMRLADMQLSFPAILVALILISIFGQGTGKVIAALVAAQWAYYARTVRGVVLVERQREYVAAARVLALPVSSILLRHLLPNCMPALIVVGALQVASAIALEATLSFLGVGLPITEPSLGLLIANGFTYLLSGKYWISFFPGLTLLATIMSINLVGDQLRDVLNPRLRAD